MRDLNINEVKTLLILKYVVVVELKADDSNCLNN